MIIHPFCNERELITLCLLTDQLRCRAVTGDVHFFHFDTTSSNCLEEHFLAGSEGVEDTDNDNFAWKLNQTFWNRFQQQAWELSSEDYALGGTLPTKHSAAARRLPARA